MQADTGSQRKIKHKLGRWFTIGLFMTGCSVMVFAVSSRWSDRTPTSSAASENSEPTGVAVELVSVVTGQIDETVKAVGTLHSNESVMVRSEIAGRISRIPFTNGQRVAKGALLVELEGSELQAQLAHAAAQVDLARLTYNRMKRLGSDGNNYVSQEQIDQAASALKTADAAQEFARVRLEKTKITAPFSGFVGIRRVSPGDYVEAGKDLVNLEDLDTLNIDFKLPETLLSRLVPGQQVHIVTDAYPKEEFEGTIDALDPRIDSANRALHLRARIPNDGRKLRPGLFATVTIVLGRDPNALLIPEEAIIPNGGKTSVYRVLDGVARWMDVRTGGRKAGWVQVAQGLNEGDIIVRAGQHKLKDGMPVIGVE
jgi:membrane fusion protein (multidrug efflux system)